MDVSNPLSTFRRQTSQKKRYIMPSRFVKDEWLGLRGMDDKDKFIQEEDNKADAWKDDGLHAIVAKDSISEEKKLAKQQKTVGAFTHLTLQAMESYSVLYKKVSDMVMWSIGQPDTVNPEWTGEDDTFHSHFMYIEWQNRYFAHFQNIQRESQVEKKKIQESIWI